MAVFSIRHITRYQYDRPVKESMSQVRIFPLPGDGQMVRQFELLISHAPVVAQFTDYYGNVVGDFNVLLPHQELSIDARLLVETTERAHDRPAGTCSLASIHAAIANDVQLLRLAEPERIAGQAIIQQILQQLPAADEDVLEFVWRCCDFIYHHFRYEKGITNVETTVDEILDHRSGVCQDFAHVMLQLLRTVGIPARYVSGYICPNKSGLRGEGATHAWVEAWLPNLGWVGIDPTNNVWVNGRHVLLATGRDFRDCTPVKGTFKGLAKQSLSVQVSVGYEDGHVFEELNQVKMQTISEEGLEPWQSDWMQAQQQ